jgi:hypothetical protein
MRYITVALVWLALVVIAIIAIALPLFWTERSVASATRSLSKNHLVQSGDLESPGLSGRYVRERMSQGKLVLPADLAPVPLLDPDQVLIAKPIDARPILQGQLNAGADVRFCKADKEIGEKVTVLAVLCPTMDKPCTALLAISPEKAKSVAEVLAADVKITPASKCEKPQ